MTSVQKKLINLPKQIVQEVQTPDDSLISIMEPSENKQCLIVSVLFVGFYIHKECVSFVGDSSLLSFLLVCVSGGQAVTPFVLACLLNEVCIAKDFSFQSQQYVCLLPVY